MTVISIHYSRLTNIGQLHAQKITEVVLVYVYRITFPAIFFTLFDLFFSFDILIYLSAIKHNFDFFWQENFVITLVTLIPLIYVSSF